MTSKEIMRDFLGTVCSVCGGQKNTRDGLCRRCYHSLPSDLRTAMWRRFGSGYEQAFIEARRYLVENTKDLGG